MKRSRAVYEDSAGERAIKVEKFIRNLHFSVPLYRLRQQSERRPCPKCQKRRFYYCYDCLTVTHPESHPPPLSLPLNVYAILHAGELRSKSTSVAASTISPDLHIIEYPEIPTNLKPENTLVLYPSSDSVEFEAVECLEKYTNVIFVESTWQKSKSIAHDSRLKNFKRVRIKEQSSLFWRFQNNDPTYLATVEAIYYTLREYVIHTNKVKAAKSKFGDSKVCDDESYYSGEVDDILFYYINQYIGVQQRYSGNSPLKYTDRHFEGYILEKASWDTLIAPPETKSTY
ncbi:unnamed protein product [Phytomonas sp. Hart1]|nr:unnamed protein product [Phytomonas sp. Hart1]|eukprot:CCW72267.1 unnamed protein product [Phytomonas sp. isolate Hart1]